MGGVEFKMQWIKVLYTFGYTVRFWGCYKLLEHLLRFEMWIDRGMVILRKVMVENSWQNVNPFE